MIRPRTLVFCCPRHAKASISKGKTGTLTSRPHRIPLRPLPPSPVPECTNTQVAPENPKAWRALVDFLETGNDNKALAEAISKCVEIAETKGNFGRSRPLRIRLSEVREASGDRRGSLAALKEFTSNSAAVSSTTAPAPSTAKNVSAAVKNAAAETLKAAERARDAENASMKERSTRLFMEINADLVPAPAPVAPRMPVQTRPRAAAASPPKPPAVKTVAEAAKIAAAASASGRKLSTWVKNVSKAKSMRTAEEIVALGDGGRLEELAEHCARLEEAGDPSARRRAAVAVANSIAASNEEGPWVEAQLREFLNDTGNPAAREGALLAIQAMCELANPGGEPYVVALLPLVLLANGAPAAPVRAAAADAGAALARSLNPHAVRLVLPAITKAVESDAWRIKAGALEVMATLAECSPAQVALALPEIVPVVSHQVTFLCYVQCYDDQWNTRDMEVS